jgi:hypothetical protein
MSDDLRRQVLDDPSIPDPVRKALEGGSALEEIRLDDRGQWWHRDERIDHPRIRQLFSRSVDRTEGGTWVLRIWRFTYPITVDDTGFFVTAVEPREEGDGGGPAIDLRLSDGSVERLDPITLAFTAPDRLVARVKGGRFLARFLRTAYHDLLDGWLEAEGERFALVLGDKRYRLEPE